MARTLPFGRGYRKGEDRYQGQQESWGQRARELDLEKRWFLTRIITPSMSPYSASVGEFIRCSPGLSNTTITIPSASKYPAKIIGIRNITTDLGNIIIQPTFGETINRLSSLTVNGADFFYELISDGEAWFTK